MAVSGLEHKPAPAVTQMKNFWSNRNNDAAIVGMACMIGAIIVLVVLYRMFLSAA